MSKGDENPQLQKWPDGTKRWVLKNGDMHREDGPALIWGRCGTKVWYRHNEKHRDGLPAVVRVNGQKEWWIDGKRQLDPSQREENDGGRLKDG